MSWKPTEGQKRADAIIFDLEVERIGAGLNGQDLSMGCPMMRSRLFDAVAKALDQALADGAERDAMEKVVGNGQGAKILYGNGGAGGYSGTVMVEGAGNGHADPDDYSELATYKVGDHVTIVGDSPIAGDGIITAVTTAPAAEPAPKKRRGRPPGSKGAKAKKKAKAGKGLPHAPVPGEYVAAPVPETVAPTVTEQSEAPQ